MASLALGLTGAAIGGNFGNMGASIGWAIGSYIGVSLFTDDINTYGPRLSDLKVTSSAYGASIPTVYGTYRIAGNVIWSAGLKETAHTQSVGGKGGPSQTHTSYTYSCSFAVGLCEGTITGIRKIWADGTLIYNKGDTATADELSVSNQIGITVYTGSEIQEPDSTIESDKGIGNVPAYRGLAYVVFENLQLEKYGNRIPNITCEVVEVGSSTYEITAAEDISHDIVLPHNNLSFSPQPYYVSNSRVEFYAPQWENDYPATSTLKKYVYQDGSWSETDIPVSSPGVMPDGTTDAEGSWWITANGMFDYPDDFSRPWGSFTLQNSVATGVTNFGKALLVKAGSSPQVRIVADAMASCSDGSYVYAAGRLTETITKYDMDLNVVKQVSAPAWDTIYQGITCMRVCDGAIYLIPQFFSGSATQLWKISLDLESVEFIGYLPGDFSPSAWTSGFNVESGILTIAYGYADEPLKIRKFVLGDMVSSNTIGLGSVINSLCSKAEVLPDVSSVLNTLKGYSRTGPMTAAAAIAPLLSTYSITAAESDFQLKFEPKNGAVDTPVDTAQLAATSDADKSKDPLNITRMKDTELPKRITVAYASEERDYGQGIQYAQRIKTDG